jgi:serine/threonine protein kinase
VTAIAGRYQPLDPLRPGAASRRARDLQTAQTVLLREITVSPDDRHAVLARAQAAQGVCHPSLVTLFDVSELPDDRLLLAYEYVTAQSLAQVSGGGSVHPRRAAMFIADIAEAVTALHARGVVHGGITQDTVIVTLKGKAKLDRVGDPRVQHEGGWHAAGDVGQMATLLEQLTGSQRGVAGLEGVHVIVERARRGQFESPASFAGMLRRLSAQARP